MWEYNADLNRFGTPESLMVLPMWTDGCIDSMEGLLFESASTTPYHFLNQAELSEGPSEAMSGLDYTGLDIPLGVEHLQLLGVKYFMASSPVVEQAANADPELQRVATSGPWNTNYQGSNLETTWDIYMVRDSGLVTALTKQPVVLKGVGNAQSQWLPVATKWYADPTTWSTEMTQGGPTPWKRVTASVTHPVTEALPTVHVTDVTQSAGGDQISFHVDKIGVPVLVKISYFPDWHASGAEGPWRAEPNLMVVVPTSHNVVLSYGSSGPGDLGAFLTFLGVIALCSVDPTPLGVNRSLTPCSPPPNGRTGRCRQDLEEVRSDMDLANGSSDEEGECAESSNEDALGCGRGPRRCAAPGGVWQLFARGLGSGVGPAGHNRYYHPNERWRRRREHGNDNKRAREHKGDFEDDERHTGWLGWLR